MHVENFSIHKLSYRVETITRPLSQALRTPTAPRTKSTLPKSRRLDNLTLIKPRLRNSTTRLTSPPRLIGTKPLNHLLHLRPQIRTHKPLLPHNPPTVPTVPPQSINHVRTPRHLQDNTDRVAESHGTMRRIRR